jgi:hypothetical protein
VLAINGRLPLEQGLAFEQAIRRIAKEHRADDKARGEVLEWQQYTADALLTLATRSGDAGEGGDGAGGGLRRSSTTLIVHLSEDTPPLLEGAGPISPETADYLACDSRHVTIKLQGRDLVHSRVGRCASYAQLRALHKRTGGCCQYPGCTATRELDAHHMREVARRGETELANLILLCSRHHKHLHDHHIHATGNARHPVFRDEHGRTITTNQPHAPTRL